MAGSGLRARSAVWVSKGRGSFVKPSKTFLGIRKNSMAEMGNQGCFLSGLRRRNFEEHVKWLCARLILHRPTEKERGD